MVRGVRDVDNHPVSGARTRCHQIPRLPPLGCEESNACGGAWYPRCDRRQGERRGSFTPRGALLLAFSRMCRPAFDHEGSRELFESRPICGAFAPDTTPTSSRDSPSADVLVPGWTKRFQDLRRRRLGVSQVTSARFLLPAIGAPYNRSAGDLLCRRFNFQCV